MKRILGFLIMAAILAVAGMPAATAGGGRVYGGVGIYFGGPVYRPYYPGYYGRPYYYPRPYYWTDPYYTTPAPVVVVPSSPPVYVERSDGGVTGTGESGQYWYYCAEAKNYYPYVRDCPGGWQRVLPQPAQ